MRFKGTSSELGVFRKGHVAELADALALGASGAIRVGSSPSVPTDETIIQRK
jgi:hypothetical protein